MTSTSCDFDYAIIGAGAAGLQLALALSGHPFFENKNIVLFEKEPKTENDRTWCFWEKGKGQWDHLIRKSWATANFFDNTGQLTFDINPYQYKMLEAADFNDYALKQVVKQGVAIINEEVLDVIDGDFGTINTTAVKYTARHIFDSRIDSKFFNVKDKHVRLLQHFRGWEIETPIPVFDDDSFTMMDFRIKWPETTSFMYVLPISPNKALLEFTFFSPSLANSEDYEKMIKSYIDNVIKIENYKVIKEEAGIIPMSDYPFYKDHQKSITKIGTAGGWVKASSGYSFKNCERFISKIIHNITQGNPPAFGLRDKKFEFFDSVVLNVLYHKNYIGEKVFSDMYRKNDIHQIFKFLDNQTSIKEDVAIINSFDKMTFLKAAIKHWLR